REIQKNIGFKPRYFRPPYGVTNPMVASAVKSLGYTTIGWSLRSFDTMYENSAALLKRVMSLVKGGDVILFHDYCDSTIEILPTVLMNIKKLGLKIVRVDDLLNEKPYV
ncbi:MAG: polysaccharide deacetylase family protein, partial [Bacteroidota bacterium]